MEIFQRELTICGMRRSEEQCIEGETVLSTWPEALQSDFTSVCHHPWCTPWEAPFQLRPPVVQHQKNHPPGQWSSPHLSCVAQHLEDIKLKAVLALAPLRDLQLSGQKATIFAHAPTPAFPLLLVKYNSPAPPGPPEKSVTWSHSKEPRASSLMGGHKSYPWSPPDITGKSEVGSALVTIE